MTLYMGLDSYAYLLFHIYAIDIVILLFSSLSLFLAPTVPVEL